MLDFKLARILLYVAPAYGDGYALGNSKAIFEITDRLTFSTSNSSVESLYDKELSLPSKTVVFVLYNHGGVIH